MGTCGSVLPAWQDKHYCLQKLQVQDQDQRLGKALNGSAMEVDHQKPPKKRCSEEEMFSQ